MVEPVETHVLLREHRQADADAIFEWMRDPAAVRMAALTAKDPDDRAALEPTRPLVGRAASANAGSAAVLRKAGFVEIGRDVGFAEGVGAEVEETIFRLG